MAAVSEHTSRITKDQLRSYDFWRRRSPSVILRAAEINGGWDKVFPPGRRFPRWASRVRNYFNWYSEKLRLTSEEEAFHALQRNHYFLGITGFLQSLAASSALSDYVFKDEHSNYWFQMTATGSIYHFEGLNMVSKFIGAMFRPPSSVPIFKLVSPRGPLSGSNELVLKNPRKRKGPPPPKRGKLTRALIMATNDLSPHSTPQPPSDWFQQGRESAVETKTLSSITHLIEKDPHYQGSYNFAETIQGGYFAHSHADMQPHSTQKGFYVDPEDREMFLPLSKRTFPDRDMGPA